MTRRIAVVVCCALSLLWLRAAEPVGACFGARLRIGVVVGAPARELASYATGYFVEEKTGIEPEFVRVGDDPEGALLRSEIDLYLAAAAHAVPGGMEIRDAGAVPGFGAGRFWIHPEVLDDLRFFTVDRALGAIHQLFAAAAYRDAVESGEEPRRAARQAVLRGP